METIFRAFLKPISGCFTVPTTPGQSIIVKAPSTPFLPHLTTSTSHHHMTIIVIDMSRSDMGGII